MKFSQKVLVLAATMGTIVFAPVAMADVFEVVSAPIADGVSVEQMAAADKPVGEFVSKLPGFISRENGVSAKEEGISPGNEWFVIVRWDSLEHAQAAAKALNASPETSAAMMKSMKADQVFFRHYTVQE